MIPPYFSTIPVAGKTPLVAWTEFQKRLATVEEKTSWGKTDLGIVTGPISRIFVLDIDGEKGENSVKDYKFPRTWTVKTPHGIHYYFRWTESLVDKVTTKTSVLEGVDVRGDGGYVKFYGWVVAPNVSPLAEPPKWLIDLLPNKHGSIIVQDSKFNGVMSSIKNGNRNESFTKLAGSLRARGYKPEEIFNLLQPKAKEVEFSDRELQLVCQSVGRYPVDPNRVPDESNNSLSDFLADAKDISCREHN